MLAAAKDSGLTTFRARKGAKTEGVEEKGTLAGFGDTFLCVFRVLAFRSNGEADISLEPAGHSRPSSRHSEF